MRRGSSGGANNGRNGRAPRSPSALLRRCLLLRPPALLQTTRGRRAVALVACLSLFLYLTLVEPYYAQRRRAMGEGVSTCEVVVDVIVCWGGVGLADRLIADRDIDRLVD